MSDTDKAIISESYINILQHRVEELEAENAKLWSEQHEGQRVYRRLLSELEEQRVINSEQREQLNAQRCIAEQPDDLERLMVEHGFPVVPYSTDNAAWAAYETTDLERAAYATGQTPLAAVQSLIKKIAEVEQ